MLTARNALHYEITEAVYRAEVRASAWQQCPSKSSLQT
jgi:hypothetical protein